MIAVCAGGQSDNKKAWEEYSPNGGNFTIRFPGKPKETTQITKSQIGEVKVITATYATSEGNIFMVSYSDLPANATKMENLETLFEGVREGAKGKDGKVLEDKEFKLESKFPAHKLLLEKEKGEQRVKLWVVVRDNRLFQLWVVGTRRFAEGPDAKAFLESLELTK
jgi:hypothetical protein